jgi:hypothetical protein
MLRVFHDSPNITLPHCSGCLQLGHSDYVKSFVCGCVHVASTASFMHSTSCHICRCYVPRKHPKPFPRISVHFCTRILFTLYSNFILQPVDDTYLLFTEFPSRSTSHLTSNRTYVLNVCSARYLYFNSTN